MSDSPSAPSPTERTASRRRRVAPARYVVMAAPSGLSDLPYRASRARTGPLCRTRGRCLPKSTPSGEGPPLLTRVLSCIGATKASQTLAKARRRSSTWRRGSVRAYEKGASAVLRVAAGDHREIDAVRHTRLREHPQASHPAIACAHPPARGRAERRPPRNRVNHDAPPARCDLRQDRSLPRPSTHAPSATRSPAGGRLRALPYQAATLRRRPRSQRRDSPNGCHRVSPSFSTREDDDGRNRPLDEATAPSSRPSPTPAPAHGQAVHAPFYPRMQRRSLRALGDVASCRRLL